MAPMTPLTINRKTTRKPSRATTAVAPMNKCANVNCGAIDAGCRVAPDTERGYLCLCMHDLSVKIDGYSCPNYFGQRRSLQSQRFENSRKKTTGVVYKEPTTVLPPIKQQQPATTRAANRQQTTPYLIDPVKTMSPQTRDALLQQQLMIAIVAIFYLTILILIGIAVYKMALKWYQKWNCTQLQSKELAEQQDESSKTIAMNELKIMNQDSYPIPNYEDRYIMM